MELSFDVNQISTIKIYDREKEKCKWLPRKQKTTFFGLIKLDKWHEEGFYSGGEYISNYMGYEMEVRPNSRQYLIDYGYQIDEDNTVWSKPLVIVQLGPKESVSRRFETIHDAQEWASELRQRNGGNFEIVNYEK